MGNIFCPKKKKPLSYAKNINNNINDKDFIMAYNENNNIFPSLIEKIIQIYKKLFILNFNDINAFQKLDEFFNSINEIEKNYEELKNKYNTLFNGVSIYNDYILYEMKKEFVKNNNNIFKNETNNLDLIIKHDEKILYLYKEKDNVKSEIENLKSEKENLKSLISKKEEEINLKINKLECEIMKIKNENINIEKEKKLKEKEVIENNELKLYNEIINKKQIENRDKTKREYEDNIKLFSGKNYARVGLENIGNNCYINSVLQILKNIPKFTYKLTKLNNTSDKFLNSLKDLIINICKTNISSFSPKEFKTNLGLENKIFSGYNQYDSIIFYVSLLTIINRKLNEVKKDNYKKLDMKQYDNKNLQDRFKIWKNNFLSKNQTFIFGLFYIYFINEIECDKCKYKTQTFQSMNFLDLPIITAKGVIKNLKECFENYQMKKSLDDDYCSKCHKAPLSQQFIILEFPPVLIINLKRVGEKNIYYNEIDIPFQLNMEEIIKQGENKSIYELRGFIKHLGDEKSGHNYAICKNMFDDKWYSYNDSICTPIEPQFDKTFFLCYIKMGNDLKNIKYLKKIVDSLNENNFFNLNF